MRYVEKVFVKDFVGENKKETYLKMWKWTASNILSASAGIKDVMFDVEQIELGEDKVKFRLTVYVSLEEKEVNDTLCRVCKELHSSFFLSSESCNLCRAQAYRNRMVDKIGIKKRYFKEKFRRKGLI